MEAVDLKNLLSPLILTGASIVLMVLVSLKRNHTLANISGLIAFALAFLALFKVDVSANPHKIGDLFIVDSFALFYSGMILLSAFAVNILSFGYFQKQKEQKEEYYMMLILATLGSVLLVSSTHFASLFLGLELLSVSLYVLIAYLRDREVSVEGGVKYLILAAVSSAFLLFGMALVYVQLGTMSFGGIGQKLAGMVSLAPLTLVGFAMMVVGVGFKLAVVPFHMWTPDVYQGAPAPVTAFIATASKGGMFALLLRFFYQIDGYQYSSLLVVFSVIAIASMFTGNLLALLQSNVKRILAYSSIAHLGYVLVAFLAGGELGAEAATFYLVAYFITTLGAFGIVTVFSGKESEAETVDDYKGLFWRYPWMAVVFTAMLFSLAGIPLTAGFIGKYFVLASGVESKLWVLVLILVVNSVIGLFYYLRVVVAMFSKAEETTGKGAVTPFPFGGSVALGALAILLVWYGVYPAALMDMISGMVGSLY